MFYVFKKMDKDYKTLVLSGNSTNGIVTLGAVQYLYDKNCCASLLNYVGTSSGAIINSLLCVGYTPLEILEYLCVTDIYKQLGHVNITKFILEGEGLLEFDKIKQTLVNMFELKVGFVPTLADLWTRFGKNFVCVTIDDTNQKRVYLSRENYPNMLVTDAVHMSACFPIIFKPFQYETNMYVDGGVGDNFPIKFSKKFIGEGVGICVVTKPGEFKNIPHVVKSFIRLLFLHNNIVAEDQDGEDNRDCFYLKGVEPSFFDFSSSPLKLISMFYQGYNELEKMCQLNKHDDDKCAHPI